MYSVEVGDVSKLLNVMSVADTSWVTVVGTADGVLVIADTNEIFAVLQLKSTRAKVDKDLIFRVKCDVLKNVASDGCMEIVNTDGRVNISFVNGASRKTVKIAQHQAFTTTFMDKLKVVSGSDGDGTFDASSLQKIVSIARKYASFVEVNGGVASTMDRSGVRVLRTEVCAPDICLSAKAAYALFQCSNRWQRTQNYVMAVDGNFGVLVVQSRGNAEGSYVIKNAREMKAAAISLVDLSEVFPLALKMPKSKICIDFRNSVCTFENGEEEYTVCITQENTRIADGFDGTVCVPATVFAGIVSKLCSGFCTIKVKHNLNMIECGDYTILCK